MIQIPTKNYWKDRIDPNGIKHRVRALVLHITDSSLETTLNWFQNPAGASAHYVVREDGEVIQMVQEFDASWHAGKVVNPRWAGYNGSNPNYSTIGVEVVSKGQFPPIKQWFAWARLCKDIIDRYELPLNALGVVHHNEIRGDKTCPGTWFTRSWLFLLMSLIKAGYSLGMMK